MKRDVDPAAEQGPQKSDQELLDDLHRLEAALNKDDDAPMPAAGEIDAHAA